ncbi:MAG TPA: hypothetical protein VGW78_06775 [Candidatus Babeliales bacterium]|jgi:hypothetical protein|nr:hypothetical protein [Candidatus Babeliales bacterium]
MFSKKLLLIGFICASNMAYGMNSDEFKKKLVQKTVVINDMDDGRIEVFRDRYSSLAKEYIGASIGFFVASIGAFGGVRYTDPKAYMRYALYGIGVLGAGAALGLAITAYEHYKKVSFFDTKNKIADYGKAKFDYCQHATEIAQDSVYKGIKNMQVADKFLANNDIDTIVISLVSYLPSGKIHKFGNFGSDIINNNKELPKLLAGRYNDSSYKFTYKNEE